MKKYASLAALAFAVILVIGCGDLNSDTNTVDDKKELPVPNTTVTCLMMEVEIESAAGEEKGEHVYCATREEYDANRTGDEWRNKDGKVIK